MPLVPQGLQVSGSFTRWQGNFFKSALLVGRGAGVAPAGASIFRYIAGQATWSDKIGNLAAVFSPTDVYQVDRDSMGSA